MSRRSPSHAAYFVALGGVLLLLALLAAYCLYFCVKRVKQLSREGLPQRVESVRPPPPPAAPAAPYPVQPGVRASASAMARLCHSPRAAPRTPLSPRSPRVLSPNRHVYAQRSTSLTPAHTDTVYPRAHNTLPPPTVLAPSSTVLAPSSTVLAPSSGRRTNYPQRIDLSYTTSRKAPTKSPKASPRKEMNTVWKDLSVQKDVLPSRRDVRSKTVVRRERSTVECRREKHLSAPPDIVVEAK